MRQAFLIALSIFSLARFGPPAAAADSIILATTTSTRDSGLLDALLPVFTKRTGITVKSVAVGTGKALAMARRGDADIVLTHAPEAEQSLVDEGWLVRRSQFMHNDFVIVGPPSDPAGIPGAKRASEALHSIAAKRVTFISRGDQSGTHQKELSLWRQAGIAPQGKWRTETGQGMGATLRIASEKDAYTLADRATYLSLKETLASRILCEGDPILLNRYSVMLVNPARHPDVHARGARAFYNWLLGGEARALIRDYGRKRFGQPLFFLEPVR